MFVLDLLISSLRTKIYETLHIYFHQVTFNDITKLNLKYFSIQKKYKLVKTFIDEAE